MNSSNTVFAVGPYPPPLHGASFATAALVDRFQQAGGNVIRINTSAFGLGRSVVRRATKLPRILRGLALAVKAATQPETVLYLSVAGGMGQLYDAIFVVLFRLARKKIFLHHHSYAYLRDTRFVTRALLWISGNLSTQIVLCEDMAQLLGRYGIAAKNIFVLSNGFAVRLKDEKVYPPKKRLKTLGFLSNISPAKGIFEFIDILREIVAVEENATAIIAGGFQDSHVDRAVRNALRNLPQAEYIGPVDEKGKDEFFSRIDVLIFPTKYVNEAQPLTILEAMTHGVPVIASARGCIPSMVSEATGRAVSGEEDFVTVAARQIRDWIASPIVFADASGAARERFVEQKLQTELSTQIVCDRILSGSKAH